MPWCNRESDGHARISLMSICVTGKVENELCIPGYMYWFGGCVYLKSLRAMLLLLWLIDMREFTLICATRELRLSYFLPLYGSELRHEVRLWIA